MHRGFIKGWAPGKLTGCEQDLAINLPGCFCLLFLLSFIRKTENARLKNPSDLLHMMILIQQFLPIHFYSNSTDKNLTLNFSLNRFLCGGGLK